MGNITEIILLIIYLGLFVLAIFIYYNFKNVNSWVVKKSLEKKQYLYFIGTSKSAFCSCFIFIVFFISQEIYLKQASRIDSYDDMIRISLFIFTPILFSIGGLIIYLRKKLKALTYTTNGLWFIALHFFAITEILLGIFCLIASLFFLVFGFGRFDGIN